MDNQNTFDPYKDNILIKPLGPILDRMQSAKAMSFMPPRPTNVHQIPKHMRMYYVIQLRDFHLASLNGLRLKENIDLMLRDGYRYRDPLYPRSWSLISGEKVEHKTPRAPAMTAVVTGHSGTGKTESVLRALNLYPKQVIEHDSFPNLVGKHQQLVWLTVDVPSTGKAQDLALSLMEAFDNAMSIHIKDWDRRFSYIFENEKIGRGYKLLEEWRQVAATHFLGFLHLDEIQNFFALPSLQRRRSKKSSNDNLQLTIIEDQCLKWILTLTNVWQIPVLISGTHDGIEAFCKRFANSQRMVTGGGFHEMRRFEAADDPLFFNADHSGFLNLLGLYQYVEHPIMINKELADLIIMLTGGIPRLIIAIWVAVHKVAMEKPYDRIELNDFKIAADTYLSPVRSAVAALISNDPNQLEHFEDLMKRDNTFWTTFWNEMNTSSNQHD